MNAAIEVAKRLNDRFLEDLPSFDHHRKIIEQLNAGYYSNGTREYEIDGVVLTSDAFVCEATTKIYFETFLIPVQGMFKFPSAVLRFDDDAPSNSDKSTPEGEMHLMLRLLTLIGIQCAEKSWKLTGDFRRNNMMFAAYRATIKTKKAPTWAVFAFQMYIDMHRELGRQSLRCFLEMRHTGSWVLDSLDKIHAFTAQSTVTCAKRDLESQAKDFGHVRVITQTDYVVGLFRLLINNRKIEKQLKSWGTDFLLKNDPLQCGLNLQKALAFLQDIGVQKEFDAAILTTTHFYNMALNNGYLPKDTLWSDLEFLIERQGVQYTFVGDRPAGRYECAKQFLLALSISATYFAKTDRSGAESTP